MASTRPFTYQQVPPPIAAYLRAHIDHRYDDAVTHLAAGVTVVDDGRTVRGRDAALEHFRQASTEFEYETDLLTVTDDNEVWTVATHIEGNFPGGEADLNMAFTLTEDQIIRLEIST
ncbi:nuclear transport factor 2 family protein [Nocardioides sp. J9]|uniref:nuclear transport factor 2 family protein n=1 Tax=Nocardioides sp. J9 TaxID=935844 RepID=UPI0011A3FD53|nr:nuclear transport factor 2 family protein [Nocardioides sp. J9]